MKNLPYLLMLLLTLGVGGCERTQQSPALGHYRATLELPGGEAPFGFELAEGEEGYVLYLSNGAERTRVDNVRFENGELIAIFPGYENSLRASPDDGTLRGNVSLIKASGKEQIIAFEAKLGETHRFFAEPATDNADVQGRWAVTFTDDEGNASPAIALFEQQHDKVTGTVVTPTGDHRYLEGQVHGDEVRLSTFAGGLAYLYHLRVGADGQLEGDYWQGLAWHERVTAQRDETATLGGSETATSLKPDAERFDFTFPNLEGTPVSLSDERFQGKVVVVTLGGSWCPNCHDEAMFLVPFYERYRDEGFEIVALMFERHGEFEKAAEAVRRYRQDLNIEFPTLIAGVSDNDDASRRLPALSGVYAYPTTILIDKKGEVRHIHTGFSGPATGELYEEYVANFTQRVEALLLE